MMDVARLVPPPPTPTDGLTRELRLRARLRLAWLSTLQDEEPVTRLLDDRDTPRAEQAWRRGTPELAPVRDALANARDDPPPLADLVRTLALSEPEADVLRLALGAAVDPEIGHLCGLLQGLRGPAAPTLELAARLFGHGRTLVLSEAQPLLAWELVELGDGPTGPSRPISIEPGLVRWLSGDSALDDLLVGVARYHRPRPALDGWPVEPLSGQLRRLLEERGTAVVVRVDGPPGSGRRTFAASVAERLDLGLLAVDPAAVPAEQRGRVYLRAQRQAWLQRCALAWVTAPPWRSFPSPFPVQFLLEGPGHRPASPEHLGRLDVRLPVPQAAERASLWRDHVAAVATWPKDELATLAERFRVTVGDVRRAAATAPRSAEEAAQNVRVAMRGSLGDLAQRLECPFRWSDLVVPPQVDESLRDLCFEASARGRLWDDLEVARLFPQGRGLLALFAGPPGTGKTMSAQVLAAELGLDLYRIDLSALVSKYIGETSKNIERVLSSAERLDAVLLFDEADALFSRRTEVKDAHDRYANADTGYLLQAIEAWPGFAILTSNKKGNMDAAFVRRLRTIIDFPAPDPALRLELWRRLLGTLCGHQVLAEQAELLERLAGSLSLSGAQIKSAVLTAAIGARRRKQPIGSDALLSGIERELWKVGRGLSRSERARLERHGPR
jgi:hypothetical protein